MKFRDLSLFNLRCQIYRFPALLALAVLLACGFAPPAHAGLIGPYSINSFTLNDPTGSALLDSDGLTWLLFTGPNDGSGTPSFADLVVNAAGPGTVQFDYNYSSVDGAPWDYGGYLVDGTYNPFATPQGNVSFSIFQGRSFGFRLGTLDNTGEPGVLQITNFSAPLGTSAVPEPGSVIVLFGLIGLGVYGWLRSRTNRMRPVALACGFIAVFGHVLSAQVQNFYVGTTITGQLTRTAVTNASQLAQALSVSGTGTYTKEIPSGTKLQKLGIQSRLSTLSLPVVPSLLVSTSTTGTNFLGLTHYDQRNANHGNQFSVEPGNPSVAVGNGFVLEGVNNAVQVYTLGGVSLLPKVISSNELFGVSPAFNRATNENGVYPTDMKVFYDQSINRFFVVERAQDYDINGNALLTSKLYVAMSQTGDPTAAYTVYTMDTTNWSQIGCPCIADYPQLGADQYGVYISVNEYNSSFGQVADARILAISKASLAANAVSPVLVSFQIPRTTGYEFTILPATTPPGASYYVASGGLEYFVSATSTASVSSTLGLWALTNTATLNNALPSMTLVQTLINSPTYYAQDVASQRPGFLPYGSANFPGILPFIDGGDTRVQSVVYAGGRLYVALGSQVQDDAGKFLVGGAWAILSPTYRNGTLAAPVLRQGYLMVKNNHILRPAMAVTAQGKGAIVFTLVGPDYYPGAGFLPINLTTTGTTVQLIAPGFLPEDGFTGYPDDNGLSRWGDSSSAVVAPDGSIWMSTGYIPNAPRTEFANWGTSIIRYLP